MATPREIPVRHSCIYQCASALACALLALCAATPARARLGADVASVQADQQAWNASSVQMPLAGATLYTQTLPNGVHVRQYADASGLVFAVAWDGPVLPDFGRLLGEHASAYADAVRRQQRGVHVQSAALVIESGGMMRSFSGRAYLPARLPPTVTAQDIR